MKTHNSIYRLWYILCITVFTFSKSAQAQYGKHEFGLEGGMGQTSYSGGFIFGEHASPAIGSYIGLSYQYNFNRYFAIRTGYTTENKGVDLVDVDFYNSNYDHKGYTTLWRRRYYTVPFLLRFSVGDAFRVFFNTGVAGSATFSGSIEVLNGSISTRKKEYNEIMGDVNFLIGMGASYRFAKRFNAAFEVRNNNGMIVVEFDGSRNQSTMAILSVNWLVGYR
ncbi:MAG: outer membrane beta-barrel protein [Bacteroidia bacterium]